MKTRSVAQLLTALMLIVGAAAIINPSSSAQTSSQSSNNSTKKAVKFLCSKSNNAPATIARTARGDIAVIRWASGFFSGAGFTPEKRCEEVSSRFQNYHNNGTLKYLTTGQMNNQPVICTAKNQGGGCTSVLFTLEPGDDPNQVLRQLLSIRSGASSGPLSRGGSSTQKPIYINLDAYLDRAPVETQSSPDSQPSAMPTSTSQPTTSQPDSSTTVF